MIIQQNQLEPQLIVILKHLRADVVQTIIIIKIAQGLTVITILIIIIMNELH